MTDLLAAVLRYPVFATLDQRRVGEWVAAAPVLRFATGDTLARRGDTPDHLLLVAAGRLRVFHPADGQEVSVGACGASTLVCDHALLPPGVLRSSVRAAADSVVRLLPLAPLRKLIAAEPDIAPHLRAWVRLHFAVRVLRDEPCLGFMTPASFLPLLDRCPELAVPCGYAVQAAGLAADSYFIVRAGRVEWRPDGGESRSFGPGAGFGAETLARRPVAGTAVAAEDCLLVRVSRDAFLDRPAGDASAQSLTLAGHSPRPAEYPWVGQEQAEECGVAALAMVARAHRLPLETADIRRHFVLDGRGASVSNLCVAAKAVGLKAGAVRLGPDQLAELVPPAIAHLTNGHFVVLYAADAEAYTVGDPAKGIVNVRRADFHRAWSGVVVLLRPQTPERPKAAPVVDADTHSLSALVGRLQDGDAPAREELIRAALARLERLTRKMLRGFPGVKRWEDTGDVLNSALLRLDLALRTVSPDSARAFLGLASEQIRRELLDLARHYSGPHGLGRNHESGFHGAGGAGLDPADRAPASDDLDKWTALHEAVERLPAEEREAFSLTFYHGWTQAQIAGLFGVTERTIRSRLRAAAASLGNDLGDGLPGG